MMNIKLGEKIRTLRKSKNISQEVLASIWESASRPSANGRTATICRM